MTELVPPIDFHIHDAEHEPVLLLGGARLLTLAIRHTGATLFLEPLKGDHHFALRFRAGVLSEWKNIGVAEASRNDWEVRADEDKKRGDVLVYLRHKSPDGIKWPAGQTHEIMLEGLQGKRGDTRATRVEFTYQHIREGAKGEELNKYPRHRQLVLINMRPRSHPPLEARLAGETGNLVLNDGSLRNTIVLEFAASRPVLLKPETRLLLRLAAGREEAPGALGKFGALQQIEVEAAVVGIQSLTVRPGLRPDADVLAVSEPHAIEWEIQRPGTGQDITIGPRNFLRIVLSGIVTKHRNGPSTVHVGWLNLGNPGEEDHPDGGVVATLQKSPLVIVGHSVGIGTIPRPRLDIDSKTVGDVKTVVELAMVELVGKSTRHGALIESPMSFVMEEYQPCGKWPCIRWRRLFGETIPWFAVQWPGVSRVVKVRYMHNQALDTGQFIRGPSADLQNHLRSLFSWWEGREHYLEDLVKRATPSVHEPDGPFSTRTNNRALEDGFIEI